VLPPRIGELDQRPAAEQPITSDRFEQPVEVDRRTSPEIVTMSAQVLPAGPAPPGLALPAPAHR
jgi:hypothetical protein